LKTRKSGGNAFCLMAAGEAAISIVVVSMSILSI
jgi:hypothetical protein